MKRILSVLLALVMIVGMIPMSILSASAAETTTISLAANKGALSSDSSSISWQSGSINVTVFKNKGNAIRTTDTAHFRMYQSHTMSISCSAGNITKIEFACESGYVDSLATASGGTASDTTITVDLSSSPVASWTSEALSGSQSRIKSVVVTYEAAGGETEPTCEHANTTTTTVDATCTEAGSVTVTCDDCSKTISTDTIPATGHNFVNNTCTGCGFVKLNLEKADSIAVGNVVVFVCEAKSVEMNDFKGTDYAYGTEYTDAPLGLYTWTVVAGASEGTYAFVNSDSKYLAWTSSNSAKTTDTLNTNSSWNVSFDEDGNAVVKNAADTNRQLQWNANSPRFACYALKDDGTMTQTAIQIYVKACEHAYTEEVTAPTCDEDGYTTYTCSKCGDSYTDNVVEATGHTFVDGACSVCGEADPSVCQHANQTTTTVDATCTTAGSVTVICDACGETISTEEIAALGHTEVVDEAVAATCTETGLTAGSHCSVCNEVIVVQTETEALGHNYVDGVCSVCGEAEPAEDVKVVFELGEDKDTTTHADGSGATAYSETVGGYTLSITGGVKMYTSANDAKGNGCIKLGTGSAAGSFSFTAPDDVTAVVINVAGYKATNAKISINSGDTQTISTYSNNGEYTAIEIDTSTTKTISFTTVSGGYRAMVNSIAFICGETDHTCVWGEGVVTTPATCTTEGVMTYTCTVDGCTKTEAIKATGHTYVYGESAITCSACDYNAAYTLNTIAEAKAYTSTSQVYYIKGIVTYVSGKNVYIEDATGAVCVYFAAAPSDIVLGDEILVWDTMTAYNGLIETSNTTSQEYVKASSGNALPSQTVTLADLLADTANEYLCERVTIEGLTIGVLGTNNTALTAADGSTINIYKAPALSENINENDTVTVTAIVSTHNGYQLLINPGTAATDVVETAAGEEEVVTTVTIAEAKAGTAGEYYQVEGTVTYISGRNVYIQDATGGIVVYLTANAATTQVGDNVKAYGALKVYNGLIELDAVDETNAEFYSILSSGNTVEAQQTSIAGLLADTTNEYLAEKVTLNNVYVSHYSYNSSYGNVTYTLTDGNGNTIQIYRVTVASEAECVAKGSIVNVEAVVSAYNGYQLVTNNDKIVVTGTCAHETTQLVNYVAATCTEGGYSGDTECVVCGVWTVRGEDTAALGHSFTENGTCANNCGTQAVIVMNGEYYTSFDDANAAYDGHSMKLLANIGENGPVTLTKTIYVDLNGYYMYAVSSTANCTVYGMDSSTDSYEAEEWGVLNVTGATVASITNTYLAIDEGENNWSFHAFSVELKYVSLDPANDALGYKAQFFGDEKVQAQVESFGFNLWLTSDRVVSKSVEKVENGQIVTLRLKNIFANNGSRMTISAEAFVTFKNNQTVKTETNNTSMMAAFQAVNEALTDNPAAYNATQIGLLKGLIERYEGQMEGWAIDAIKAWTAPGV